MKGFSPNLDTIIEVNSKQSQVDTFIELGVKQAHEEDCECIECTSLKGGEDE